MWHRIMQRAKISVENETKAFSCKLSNTEMPQRPHQRSRVNVHSSQVGETII